MNRRDFMSTVTLALLAETLASRNLLASKRSIPIAMWVAAQNDLGRRLRDGAIGGADWQRGVEELAAAVDLDELLRAIDFAALERDFKFTHDGGTKQFVRVPHPDGMDLVFGTALFGLEKRKSITPHGHQHMVSAHMVLDGKLHVRNFDRIGDEQTHLVIRPTIDDVIARGAISSMSSERNNIHWFTGLTDRAFTFDVIMDGLTGGQKPFVIDLVDPRGGTYLGNGDIRAPRIDWETSVRLYGEERR
jgi:hypothetical protein